MVILADLYVRKVNRTVFERLQEPRRFIQVLYGPRQVGKTTALKQVLSMLDTPSHYASADEPALKDVGWLERQWDIARDKTRQGSGYLVLGLDEIQKVPNWSETVKRLWDEDSFKEIPVKVVLLGSSPLLMQKGLTESLAGRFELIRMGHWSFSECREYFGWDVDSFIYYGGYPGAASLINDPERWRRYVNDSLIETTISRDILLMTRVDKPALLRRLFHLACEYSGQVLSYRKMLGQLHDAGNATTLAHYLGLLGGAGFVKGLEKFANQSVRRRASSPKLQVFDTSLITAQSNLSFEETRADRGFWGRLVESAVGAHLLNVSSNKRWDLYYWRHVDKEVDFIVRTGKKLVAIEVKSGHRKGVLSGMEAFAKAFRPDRKLLVGADGVPIDEFLDSELVGLLE